MNVPQYEQSVAEARRQERERTEKERRERMQFREDRAKRIAKDNASRLAQIQRHMESTAANIVSREDVVLPKGAKGHSADMDAIFGSK